MANTISEVANKLSNVLDKWKRLVDAIGDWANSNEDEVTLTKPDGTTYTVSSLNRILDEVEGPAATAQDAATAAEGARDAAQAAESNAQTAESNAATHEGDALAARDEAQTASSEAVNAASNIDSMLRKRYPADNKLRIPDPLTPTAVTTADNGVFAWDDQYIYVKTTIGWRKAPLQDL